MALGLDHLLHHGAADYVTFDTAFLITSASEGASRFADDSRSVVVGNDIRIGFPELVGAEDALAEVARRDRPSYALPAVCRSSSPESQLYVNITVSIQSIPGTHAAGFVMMLEDVTPWMVEIQRRAQTTNDALLLVHAMTASKEYIEHILDAMAEVLFVISPEGIITAVNRAALSLTEFTLAELIGRPIASILPDEPVAESLRGGWKGPPIELRCQTRNGDPVPVSFSRAPLIGEEHVLHGMVYLGRDLRELKHSEARISRLESENLSLQEVLQTSQETSEMVWSSPAMGSLLRDLKKVAVTDTTVLISGETGTGKELIAREIHRQSTRKGALLVNVNCAALPAGLVESELFGHEKGAFTGALQRRIGRFELANGGTVFLDEAGELPLPAQATLLRVLQEQSFERVGGTQTITVDVRVITATNRNLLDEVAQGRFREDLLFRLNVFPLHVPPLRERPQDIRPLAEHFLRNFRRRMNKAVTAIRPAALQVLERYSWPGNVRELANVIERAMIVCEGNTLEQHHFVHLGVNPEQGNHEARFEDFARDHLLRALQDAGGIIEGPHGAARKLGLKPATLRSRMKKLGIVRGAGGFE